MIWNITAELDMDASKHTSFTVRAKTRKLAIKKAESILKNREDCFFYRIDRCEPRDEP